MSGFAELDQPISSTFPLYMSQVNISRVYHQNRGTGGAP